MIKAQRPFFSAPIRPALRWLNWQLTNLRMTELPLGQNVLDSPPKQPVQAVSGTDHQLLARKNVLVTGVGRNIGQAIAVEMAKQGANLFLVDIDFDV
ncbi:MAG: hypothetical protein AAFU71_07570, partial [Cyanobacteria bacterium J06632_22]